MLSLLDPDGESSAVHVDPESLTFEELAKFPQNGIPEHLVYALKRRGIYRIRDLRGVSENQLLKIPGVGKRGFRSICRMVRLFGNSSYGKSMAYEMERTLPPYRKMLDGYEMKPGMIRKGIFLMWQHSLMKGIRSARMKKYITAAPFIPRSISA